VSIAFWCVLVAGLLPYLGATIAKAGGRRYDNRDPREWLARQEGWRKRADNFQANSFEAFPLFAAAVIIAHLAGARQATVDTLALAFVGFRVCYTLAYVYDRPLLRSLLWCGGVFCVIGLFVAAA